MRYCEEQKMSEKYFLASNLKRLKFFLKEALFISSPFAIGLLYIETCENFFFFDSFFPRGSFFKIVLDSVLLKFTFLPALKLFFFTVLIYVAVFFAASSISILCSRIFWRKTQRGFGRTIFHIFNLYVFTYLILSYNAVLHPISQQRHGLLYGYVFLQRGGLDACLPLNEFFGPAHLVFSVYWIVLVLIAVLIFFYRSIVVARSLKPILRRRIFMIAVLGIGIFLGHSFYQKRMNPQEKEGRFFPDGNIILIGLDSFQYNQLAKEWGAFSEPAPDVLKFIQGSVYFTDIWTPFARTTPSFASILTGRFPARHGIRANLIGEKYEAPDNVYLGEILRQAGYYSFFAIDDVRFFSLFHRHGFDEIFTPRRDIAGMVLASFYDYSLGNIFIYHDMAPWIFDALINNRAITAYNPHVFIKHLIKRLSRIPREQKKFIVIHLCGNHHPYTSVYPYGRDPNLPTRSEKCMAMVNDQFASLLMYLKKSDLYQGSDIYVFSDHGSGWDPERQELSHGSSFDVVRDYQSILAIYSPKLQRPKEISARARTIDLYPTILELAGLPMPSAIDGKSLLPFIEGKEEGRQRLVLAETGFSFNFCYSGDVRLQGRQVQGEIRKFEIDPETGHVFISDDQYQEILAKKWFMMIMDDWRLVFHPETNKSFLYRSGDFQNRPIDNLQKKESLLKKLREKIH